MKTRINRLKNTNINSLAQSADIFISFILLQKFFIYQRPNIKRMRGCIRLLLQKILRVAS